MQQIIMFAVVLILVIMYCVYRSMPTKPHRKIYWFFRKGCGHCTRMESAWEKFAKMCPAYIDIEKINTSENQTMADDYGVDGVPYIVKVEGNMRTVYTGDRSAEDLYSFATITL